MGFKQLFFQKLCKFVLINFFFHAYLKKHKDDNIHKSEALKSRKINGRTNSCVECKNFVKSVNKIVHKFAAKLVCFLTYF